MRMKIDRAGVEFTAAWEAFVPWPYDDKAKPTARYKGRRVPPEWKGEPLRGTLTIGFGHTDAGAHPLKIKRGMRLTEEEAYAVLDVDMDSAERSVNQLVKVPLTQGQFNALVDLVVNMGAGNFRKSTLLRRLNAGDYVGARAAFDLYVRSRGEFMQGLQNRRDAEQRLWGDTIAAVPVPDNDDFEQTPKVDVQPARSMGRSTIGNTQVMTGVGTAALGAGKVAKEMSADDEKPIEKTVVTVDGAGKVVDQVTTVVDKGTAILDAGDGAVSFTKGAVKLLNDPIVVFIVTLGIVGGCVYVWLRRKQHADAGEF